jgi:pyridoxamine 5'-phosphate oxidase
MSFDFKKDPVENFLTLFQEAQTKGIPDANAMSLATVSQDFKPANRIVLFKGIVDGGFSFYTNYLGQKGLELETNKFVCVNFFWPHLDQQVRIEGYVEKLTETQSDQYFSSRPRQSQIGAWTSLQSQELKSFDEFHQRYAEYEKKFFNQKVPRPPHWGGYRIIPLSIEFWFGRAGRLHERYVYSKKQISDDWSRRLKFP